MTLIALSVAPLADMPSASRRECERESARRLAAMMTGCTTLSIAHTPEGAPLLCGPGTEGLSVSVSHCADAVAVALSRDSAVGIDIERPSPRLTRVVPRVMRADEPADIDPLRAWTAKEAVFKCAGGKAAVLSDIRLLDSAATLAETTDGTRYAIHHSAEGLALAVTLAKER